MRRTSTSTERRPSDPNAPADTILDALDGIASPAGSGVWHVVGMQRSIREWAMRQGWGGRPVRVEQAQGILVAAQGVLAGHYGYVRNGCDRQPLKGDVTETFNAPATRHRRAVVCRQPGT